MQLRFLRGEEQAPRGHAIVLVRPYGQPDRAMATYCIVLPIQFSLGRYIPPILAAQLPLEGLREMGASPSVMPIPPMLEDVTDEQALIDLAELRQDDVVEISGVDMTNDMRRMELAAEAANEYQALYSRYAASSPSPRTRPLDDEPLREIPRRAEPTPSATNTPPIEIESLMRDTPTATDRERLGEVSRLIGTLRYAMEGKDERLTEETKIGLVRATSPLPEKYRMGELLNTAVIPDARGQRLAELYLDRAFKLLDEDYEVIASIEQQIKELS